jgi:transposase
VTDETRAHVIVSKFVDHLPYYRQSAILRRGGVEISDSTLGRMGIEAADRLAPIIVAMREELLASSMLQADETTIPVLKTEKAKPGAHRGYLWAYAQPRGTIVYDYARGRGGDHPSGFLDGYEGILQVDRYEGYNQVLAREGVIDVACWAHARRRFVDAERVSGRKARSIIEAIAKLYAIERKAREGALPADGRSVLRKRETKPILDEIKAKLRDLVVDVRPSSSLGDAVSYTLKHWRALTEYVDHGEAEICNNLIENSMRPVALGRKNYLFAGSELGAEAAAILYSLTESCRRLGIHPNAYLVDVFGKLATADPKDGDAIRALTPSRWKAARSQEPS